MKLIHACIKMELNIGMDYCEMTSIRSRGYSGNLWMVPKLLLITTYNHSGKVFQSVLARFNCFITLDNTTIGCKNYLDDDKISSLVGKW